jgi:hypothetical protein
VIATIVSDDDWTGLYLDDDMVLQDHMLGDWRILEEVRKKGHPITEVIQFEISMEDLDLGEMPASLQTLYDMGAFIR